MGNEFEELHLGVAELVAQAEVEEEDCTGLLTVEVHVLADGGVGLARFRRGELQEGNVT